MHAWWGGSRVKSEIIPVHHVPDYWKIFNSYHRQCAGCTVRQHIHRDISTSLVAALLVSIRKGSGWCISAFSSELQNLKDLSIYSTLLQCTRITWLGVIRNQQTLRGLAKCHSSLQAAELPHAPIWAHKNTEFSCHLASSHPCVWNEGTR